MLSNVIFFYVQDRFITEIFKNFQPENCNGGPNVLFANSFDFIVESDISSSLFHSLSISIRYFKISNEFSVLLLDTSRAYSSFSLVSYFGLNTDDISSINVKTASDFVVEERNKNNIEKENYRLMVSAQNQQIT